MKVLRRLAIGWVALWLTLTLGASGVQVAPVAESVPNRGPYRIQYLDRTESLDAELHQILDAYWVCEETGQWDQWPCSQWTPPSQLPR